MQCDLSLSSSLPLIPITSAPILESSIAISMSRPSLVKEGNSPITSSNKTGVHDKIHSSVAKELLEDRSCDNDKNSSNASPKIKVFYHSASGFLESPLMKTSRVTAYLLFLLLIVLKTISTSLSRYAMIIYN